MQPSNALSFCAVRSLLCFFFLEHYLSCAYIPPVSVGAHIRPTYSVAPGTIDEVKFHVKGAWVGESVVMLEIERD